MTETVAQAVEQTSGSVAVDRREELEAELWKQHATPGQVEYLMRLADRYAAAKADEEIRRQEGRRRLAEAAAEYWGSPWAPERMH